MNTDSVTPQQIDLLDEHGVIRSTIAVRDGVEEGRVAPFSGMIIRDHTGRERGGIGVLDTADGGTLPVVALDHVTRQEAVGTAVFDDGSAIWMMNDSRPDGSDNAQRIAVTVSADGTPAVALCDDQGRTRLRLTLTADGAGALEFLRADGSVAHSLVPERDVSGS